MSDRGYRRSLVALTALLGAILTLWAVLAPGFRSPDEPQHFNSVMRLATGGGWPAPGTAPVSDATLIAAREAGFARPDSRIGLLTSSILPRGTLRGWGLNFTEIVPIPPEQRSVLDQTADLQDEVAASIDQMTQHPPLYYAVGALAIRAVGGLDWRWDQQLLFLRLLGCLITVWAVPLTAGTAWRLTGSRTVGLVAAGALIGIGQFAHIGASVTNDTLTIVLGLSATYLAARSLTEQHGLRLPVLAGLVLGLGLLTKGTLLAAIPMVALSFVLPGAANPRAARRWVSALLALAVALAIGGWWWVRNILLFGGLQPDGMPPTRIDWGDQTPTLAEFLPEAINRFSGSFWGVFGWLEIPLPATLKATLGIVLFALVVASPFLRSPVRMGILALLTFPALIAGRVLIGSYGAYQDVGLFPGLQGRYLFPAVAAILTAAGLSATVLSRRLGRRVHSQLPAITLGLASVLAAYCLFYFFQAVYQPWDQTILDALVRWDAWSLFSRPVLGVVIITPAVLAVVALATLVREGRTFDPADTAGLTRTRAPRAVTVEHAHT